MGGSHAETRGRTKTKWCCCCNDSIKIYPDLMRYSTDVILSRVMVLLLLRNNIYTYYAFTETPDGGGCCWRRIPSGSTAIKSFPRESRVVNCFLPFINRQINVLDVDKGCESRTQPLNGMNPACRCCIWSIYFGKCFVHQRTLLLLKTEANEMHLCKWAALFITLSYAFLFSFARTEEWIGSSDYTLCHGLDARPRKFPSHLV